MKSITLILSILLAFSIASAQEINLGLSGHLGMWKQYTTINTSISKNKWIIRPSIKYGNFGKNDSIYPGDVEVSGYSTTIVQDLDKPFSNQYAYTTFWYSTVNKGISPELKLGRNFSKEDSKSSFSAYFSFAYYWINDKYKTHYRGSNINNMNEIETDKVTGTARVKHQNYSIGLSLGYAYKVSDKLTIEAMLNIPYYQPISSSLYNPNEYGVLSSNPKALMLNNINYDVSFGVNYQLK